MVMVASLSYHSIERVTSNSMSNWEKSFEFCEVRFPTANLPTYRWIMRPKAIRASPPL